MPIEAEGGLHHAVVDLLVVVLLEFVPLGEHAQAMSALAGLVGVGVHGDVVRGVDFLGVAVGVIPLELAACQVLADLDLRDLGVVYGKLGTVCSQSLQTCTLFSGDVTGMRAAARVEGKGDQPGHMHTWSMLKPV